MDDPNNPRADAVLTFSQLRLYYPTNPLGDAVSNFPQSKLGTEVGGGECTDLVDAALKAAGAEPGDKSVDPYVWGDEVTRAVFPDPPVPAPPEWGTWQSGDIIRFKNAQFAESVKKYGTQERGGLSALPFQMSPFGRRFSLSSSCPLQRSALTASNGAVSDRNQFSSG
jgi:hypothetical protein